MFIFFLQHYLAVHGMNIMQSYFLSFQVFYENTFYIKRHLWSTAILRFHIESARVDMALKQK